MIQTQVLNSASGHLLKKLFNIIAVAHKQPEIPVRTRLKANAKQDNEPYHILASRKISIRKQLLLSTIKQKISGYRMSILYSLFACCSRETKILNRSIQHDLKVKDWHQVMLCILTKVIRE
jgi:hypothetical protein